MMQKVAETLLHDPGGWPRFSKAAFARSAEDEARLAERVARNRPRHPWEVVFLALLVLGGIAYGDGLDFALRFYLLFLLPFLCFIPAAVVRPYLLCGLPANHACAWPKDLNGDRMRSHLGTVLSASTYWLMSIVVFLHCAQTLRSGMGDQWNPFTRTIRMGKGGPYSEYVPIEMFMLISGFFAITGLLWWPMIVFFEWLETRKPDSEQGGGANA
ncbi:hypothetical protein LHP98_05370 [Rhodobacter sp. Har01]|uniref:hypothetical protein n=1 Tax=Rhodobacter sp. Har01 TaxID=2883999 RepID=UPI001D064D83|nr:hypothetical protein [Rhodobacter sp. Har01]MCB6177559.1 hypothetical protein [Rhodobacter sp. Har01]